MTKIGLVITKIGKAYDSQNPNDFILNSLFNSFKIIKEGIKTITLVADTQNQTFRQNHGLPFTPLVTGFAKETDIAQVFAPNSENVSTWGTKAGIIGTGVKFNYIASNAEDIIFNFDNYIALGSAPQQTVDVKYYCLESL